MEKTVKLSDDKDIDIDNLLIDVLTAIQYCENKMLDSLNNSTTDSAFDVIAKTQQKAIVTVFSAKLQNKIMFKNFKNDLKN